MICSFCNNDIPNDSSFCPFCGKYVVTSKNPKKLSERIFGESTIDMPVDNSPGYSSNYLDETVEIEEIINEVRRVMPELDAPGERMHDNEAERQKAVPVYDSADPKKSDSTASEKDKGERKPFDMYTTVWISREELKNGCRKTVKVGGKKLNLNIKPNTKAKDVVLKGKGYLDTETNKRGDLYIQFVIK